MAIQTQGTTGNIMEVDTTFKAARMTLRPAEVLGWHSIGAQSGLVTGVAANGALFSLRNIAANPIMVRRIGIGFTITTGFTAAQTLDWGLNIARAFTASDTGGTAVALTGSNTKHRTSLATPTSLDCRIATTAALTAGTKTLDTNTMSQINAYAIAAGAGAAMPASLSNLFGHDAGDYPLILAQNEGLNILNLTAMGAAGVGKFYVNMELAEVTSY